MLNSCARSRVGVTPPDCGHRIKATYCSPLSWTNSNHSYFIQRVTEVMQDNFKNYRWWIRSIPKTQVSIDIYSYTSSLNCGYSFKGMTMTVKWSLPVEYTAWQICFIRTQSYSRVLLFQIHRVQKRNTDDILWRHLWQTLQKSCHRRSFVFNLLQTEGNQSNPEICNERQWSRPT